MNRNRNRNRNRNECLWLDKVNIWLKRHGFLAWLLDFSVLMLFAMITGILVFQISFLPTYSKSQYVFPLFINILVLLYYAYGSILRENSAKRITFLKDLVNPLLYINPLALSSSVALSSFFKSPPKETAENNFWQFSSSIV